MSKKNGKIMNKDTVASANKVLDEIFGSERVTTEPRIPTETSLPFALLGVTPEQAAAAEFLTGIIKQQKIDDAVKDFHKKLREDECSYRSRKNTTKFFQRHPRNPQSRIEVDEKNVIILGELWKADLRKETVNDDVFEMPGIPMDIFINGNVALEDVEIIFPIYLDCATGNPYQTSIIANPAKVDKVRFIMRDNYQEIINACKFEDAICDVIIDVSGIDAHGKRYEFTVGTELMYRAGCTNDLFYNPEFAMKGRVPGKLMEWMVERILMYYTSVWYSIMVAYLHPLTITSIVDVGKRMAEEYAHNPVKNKAPLKNIKYLKLDGDNLERVLYHSKPGKGGKYERHCQLWYVRGYMRKDGKWIKPQWRGPLAKMKRLSEDIETRQRKIVGVSLDEK